MTNGYEGFEWEEFDDQGGYVTASMNILRTIGDFELGYGQSPVN
jgi:hypothetical protein